MRIETLQSVAQLYSSKPVAKTNKTAAVDSSDQIEISQAGRDYQIAKNAVKETPDVREDLVNEIKSRIKDGFYEVSADDFAAKVIERYNQFLL